MDLREQRKNRIRSLVKPMLIMLAAVSLVLGAVFGYRFWKAGMAGKQMAGGPPPAAVSATEAAYRPWQPRIEAVGTLRASQGVDITSEVAGIVSKVHFESGEEVKAQQLLLELDTAADKAQLRSLEAAAELALAEYRRAKKQFAIKAVSRSALDAASADLKSKRAQAARQQAIIEKKRIHAPFDGKVGISTVSRGQYMNPGDPFVTLQALESIFVDFYLPQQELSRIMSGQEISVTTDTWPGRIFTGAVTAINPKVDPGTRNFLVSARIGNPRRELLPGMFVSVMIEAGEAELLLTLPRTSVTYNPYGDTVFILRKGGGPDGKQILTAKQSFVSTGPVRGDQVAILSGVKEGDLVVTSGQLKLRNNSPVVINNEIQPGSEEKPKLEEE